MASDSKAETLNKDMDEFNESQLNPFLKDLVDISVDISNDKSLSDEQKLKIKLLKKIIPVYNQMVKAKNDDIEGALGIGTSKAEEDEPDLFRTSKIGRFRPGTGTYRLRKPEPKVVETKEQIKVRLEQNVMFNKFIKQGLKDLMNLANRGWSKLSSMDAHYANSEIDNIYPEPSDEPVDATGEAVTNSTADSEEGEMKGQEGSCATGVNEDPPTVNISEIITQVIGDMADSDNDSSPELGQVPSDTVDTGVAVAAS
jgi:hypothetical protein